MVTVKVNAYGCFKDALGAEEREYELKEGPTLADLFEVLKDAHGEPFARLLRDRLTGEVVPFLLMVNERVVRSQTGMSSPLSHGDTVTLMDPMVGG
ncbi:MAG: MoaD/ThiS family protein [Nitrospinota bacterium]